MNNDLTLVFEKFDGNLFAYYNDPINWPRVSLGRKVGRMAGRTVKFFSKTETKTVTLTTYWSIATLVSAAIILEATSFLAVMIAFIMYLYGSFAFFEAVTFYNEKK